jgi:hypothetical protein
MPFSKRDNDKGELFLGAESELPAQTREEELFPHPAADKKKE